jgi:hypothetical protein
MKMYWEWRYSSTHSLTSALDGGEWSASRLGRFTPGGRAPDTHWIGGRVGPRAVLDAVAKRKIHSHRRESNPRTPIVQPVAQRYTDWADYSGITRSRWPPKNAVQCSVTPLGTCIHTRKSVPCKKWTTHYSSSLSTWYSKEDVTSHIFLLFTPYILT